MRFIRGLNIILFSLVSVYAYNQASFTWDVDKGCVPLQVRFAIDSSSYDLGSISVAEWDFDNGLTVTAAAEDTVSTVFSDKQVYAVTLTINGDDANSQTIFYNGAQDEVISTYTATKLTNAPDYTYRFTPDIVSNQTKTGANYTFTWTYTQDGDTLGTQQYSPITGSTLQDAVDEFMFPDTGTFNTQLIILEENADFNCTSITNQDLVIAPEFLVPNVFSPNSQQYYQVNPGDPSIILAFRLFSRTGQKLFEQISPIIYWDGRTSSGQELSTGVYFYIVEATEGDTEGFYSKTGFIHLFR